MWKIYRITSASASSLDYLIHVIATVLISSCSSKENSSDESSESDGDLDQVSMEGFALAKSYLDAVIMHGWEDRADLLRYDMKTIETKLMTDSPVPWVIQLNEGRFCKKRPTEVRVDVVRQPFDDAKFNFTKALQREVIFQFERSQREDRSVYHAAAVVPDLRPGKASPTLVLINVSPIEYGHVLLCPRILEKVPQLVDEYNLTMALHFADESGNEHMRIGYNSLGAYGTINHMHYQAYYMSYPYPVEVAPTAPMGQTPEGVQVCHTHRYISSSSPSLSLTMGHMLGKNNYPFR